MKTISFLNNKGGVGKTTSVLNVAYILSKKYKKKVLIVDLDPQGNLTSLFFDFDDMSAVDINNLASSITRNSQIPVVVGSKYTVEDILKNKDIDPHEAINKTKWNKTLDIIPSFITLEIAEKEMGANVSEVQQFNLRNQLKKLSTEYDYCMLDCSPSLSLVNINGLVASDMVYIPSMCSSWSLSGVANTLVTIRNVRNYAPTLDIGGFFLTIYEKQRRLPRDIKEIFKICKDEAGFEKVPFIDLTIRKSKLIEDMSYNSKPVYNPKRKKKEGIEKDYLELTKYIVKDLERRA